MDRMPKRCLAASHEDFPEDLRAACSQWISEAIGEIELERLKESRSMGPLRSKKSFALEIATKRSLWLPRSPVCPTQGFHQAGEPCGSRKVSAGKETQQAAGVLGTPERKATTAQGGCREDFGSYKTPETKKPVQAVSPMEEKSAVKREGSVGMNQKVLSDEISVTDPWRARCIGLDERVGLLSPVEIRIKEIRRSLVTTLRPLQESLFVNSLKSILRVLNCPSIHRSVLQVRGSHLGRLKLPPRHQQRSISQLMTRTDIVTKERPSPSGASLQEFRQRNFCLSLVSNCGRS